MIPKISSVIGNYSKTMYLIFFGLIALFLIPIIRRYLDNQKTKDSENTASNHAIQTAIVNNNPKANTKNANDITTNARAQADAFRISSFLGSINCTGHWYDYLNPRIWVTNQDKIVAICIYQRNNWQIIQELYFSCYSPNFNLKTDLFNLLSSDNVAKLQGYNLI